MNIHLKLTGIISFGFLLFSCNNYQGSSSSETTTPVWISTAEFRNIEEYITATGTAKAKKTIDLSTETNGAYHLQKNPKQVNPTN